MGVSSTHNGEGGENRATRRDEDEKSDTRVRARKDGASVKIGLSKHGQSATPPPDPTLIPEGRSHYHKRLQI